MFFSFQSENGKRTLGLGRQFFKLAGWSCQQHGCNASSLFSPLQEECKERSRRERRGRFIYYSHALPLLTKAVMLTKQIVLMMPMAIVMIRSCKNDLLKTHAPFFLIIFRIAKQSCQDHKSLTGPFQYLSNEFEERKEKRVKEVSLINNIPPKTAKLSQLFISFRGDDDHHHDV